MTHLIKLLSEGDIDNIDLSLEDKAHEVIKILDGLPYGRCEQILSITLEILKEKIPIRLQYIDTII